MMKKRKILLLISILLLLIFFVVALYHFMISYDGMNLSNKADDKVGFIRLCLWDWSVIPLVLLNWAGSMLLGSVFLHSHLQNRWQRVLIGVMITIYTVLFIPLMFYNKYADFMLQTKLLFLLILVLPIINLLMVHSPPLRYLVLALYTLLLLWGCVICIVNYAHRAWTYSFLAASMLIPSSLLLRNWLCPNSRIASVAAVMVFGWSAYMVESEFIRYLILKGSILGGYSILYIAAMVAVALSLICLIIDTVMVFLSHSKAAVPAVPGDPPAPAEA